MEDVAPPPIDQYRRVQIARYLIDKEMSEFSSMAFDENGKIVDFGISPAELDDVIDSGYPFMTSGCTGRDGKTVACNRPYGNSRPGRGLRNYPFVPDEEDVRLIRAQMETGLDEPLIIS